MRDENKFQFLEAKRIRIKGVKHLFEKCLGKRDTRENQLCKVEDGHTTPIVESKVSSCDSHIDGIFLKTSMLLDPMVQEAHALTTELKLLGAPVVTGTSDNAEEAQRLAAIAAAKAMKASKRKDEILIRLAAIRAESDMVNELLMHYTERANSLLDSRISKYWRGVLAASAEDLKPFPSIHHKESSGKQAYDANRGRLLGIINEALKNNGGDFYEIETAA